MIKLTYDSAVEYLKKEYGEGFDVILCLLDKYIPSAQKAILKKLGINTENKTRQCALLISAIEQKNKQGNAKTGGNDQDWQYYHNYLMEYGEKLAGVITTLIDEHKKATQNGDNAKKSNIETILRYYYNSNINKPPGDNFVLASAFLDFTKNKMIDDTKKYAYKLISISKNKKIKEKIIALQGKAKHKIGGMAIGGGSGKKDKQLADFFAIPSSESENEFKGVLEMVYSYGKAKKKEENKKPMFSGSQDDIKILNKIYQICFPRGSANTPESKADKIYADMVGVEEGTFTSMFALPKDKNDIIKDYIEKIESKSESKSGSNKAAEDARRREAERRRNLPKKEILANSYEPQNNKSKFKLYLEMIEQKK